jgi:hypothetical protein
MRFHYGSGGDWFQIGTGNERGEGNPQIAQIAQINCWGSVGMVVTVGEVRGNVGEWPI